MTWAVDLGTPGEFESPAFRLFIHYRWHWDLDRGGAAARAHHLQADPAFVFAEMQHSEYTPAGWVPKFADYPSLSFWTATAFSPADVSPIKRWAKLMMMTDAAVSLVIGILVVARAVNILQ